VKLEMESTMSVQDLAELADMLTAFDCSPNPVWKFRISGGSTVRNIYICPAPTYTEAEDSRSDQPEKGDHEIFSA